MEFGSAILFLPEAIKAFIEPGRSGVYVLGVVDNGFCYKYVGRSDICLRTRLLEHEYLYRFPYFIFKYAGTPEEAFVLESKWWHDCNTQNIRLYNRIHPDAPSHSTLSCPYCQFSLNWGKYEIDLKAS